MKCKVVMSWALVLVCWQLSCGLSHAAPYFTEHFNDLSAWTGGTDGSNAPSSEDSVGSGSALRKIYTDPNVGGGPYFDRPIPTGPTDVFMEVYLKAKPGWQSLTNTKHFYIGVNSAAIILQTIPGGGLQIQSADVYPGQSDVSLFNLGQATPIGSWKKIGIRYKLNTIGQSDGFLKVCIDGSPVQQWSGLRQRTASNVVVDAIREYRERGLGTIYHDEMVVWPGTAELNCATAQGDSASDNSPPNPPTGLTIR